MTELRDQAFVSCNAHDGPGAPGGPPSRGAIRRPRNAWGAGLGVLLRSAFRDGRLAFVVKLWVEAAVFAVAASAIAVAVWRQDPGAQAAAPRTNRVAFRSPGYAPARGAGDPAMPPAGLRVARRANRNVPASDRG